jgi:hypothetical protein
LKIGKERKKLMTKIIEKKNGVPVLLDRKTYDTCRHIAVQCDKSTASVVRDLLGYAIDGLKREAKASGTLATKPEKKAS